jgi:hypothetical protein
LLALEKEKIRSNKSGGLMLLLTGGRSILILGFLGLAFGFPIYIAIAKKRAQISLNQLLAERFSACPLPVAEVTVPSGGKVIFHSAYTDKSASGLVLMLGNLRWQFAKGGAYVRVAGLFKPGGDPDWLERVRRQRDVIVAATMGDGALFIWKGTPSWKALPSRGTVIAHIEAVR